MSMKRVSALFIKEMQDLRRNTSILSMLLVPPLMTFLWSGLLKLPANQSFTIGTMFAVVMAGVYSPAMMFAEEKEKNTLRVLMLSPATPGEILVSKGLVTLLMIILVTLLLIPISGVTVLNYSLFAVVLVLGSVFVISLGFLIGLFSPNQMSTGYIGMPIYLILLLVPMLGQQSPALAKLAKFVPSNFIGDGVFKAVQGQSLAAGRAECLALALASAITLTVFIAAYRHKELSE